MYLGNTSRHRGTLARRALSIAVTTSLAVASSAVFAQATVGTVFGNADAGSTVTLTNNGNGSVRNVTVGTDGKFRASSLLPGDYTVTETGGTHNATRTITVVAGQGFNLDLVPAAAAPSDTNAQNLSTVSVTANGFRNVTLAWTDAAILKAAQRVESTEIPTLIKGNISRFQTLGYACPASELDDVAGKEPTKIPGRFQLKCVELFVAPKWPTDELGEQFGALAAVWQQPSPTSIIGNGRASFGEQGVACLFK